MRIFDVPWINHEGSSIFSIDIHPHGKKLATGGQDQSGAGLLVIWPIEFIYEEIIEKCNSESYSFLARIPHSKSINCVRWCKNGQRLVCAGDDPVICVYECMGNFTSLGTLGSKSSKSKVLENYRCVHMLYGHFMDVLHVDWSPDGKYLASGSFDNSVIVWNAEQFPEKVITLKHSNGGHNRAVKGLSWDPIGRFLATQSEDNSLKLWQTDSWECVQTITEPFNEVFNFLLATGSTLFLRMDWSPDGSYIVCPGAMNNGGPTANIVIRKNWNYNRDLVGFRKAVTCVRSNSRCFYRVNSSRQRLTVSCFATGCRNRSLAVWLVPSFGRPLLVLEKIFKLSVLDLSWNDLTLAACSNDGNVKIICFNEYEIGEALSSGEMVSLSEKTYGFLPDIYKNSSQIAKTSLLNDNFIYSNWHASIQKKLATNKNIFNKRKFSSFEFEAVVSKIKRQQLGSNDINKVRCQKLLKNIDFSLLKTDKRFLERDSENLIFILNDNKRQIVVETIKLCEKCIVNKIEVLNEFSFDGNTFEKGQLNNNSITQITAFDNKKKKIWSIYTKHIVLNIASNSFWTCFTTYNSYFMCYSTQTSRLIFSFLIDAPSCALFLNENICYIIMCNGIFLHCDIKNRTCSSSNINILFNNNVQQLSVTIEPKLKLIMSDYNCFFKISNRNLKDSWIKFADILQLFFNFDYPLVNFISFFVIKDIADNLTSFSKMLPPLSLLKTFEQIKSTRNEDLNKDTVLLKMLSDSFSHNFDSQTRFFVSIIILRLLKKGFSHKLTELKKYLEIHSPDNLEFCLNFLNYITNSTKYFSNCNENL